MVEGMERMAFRARKVWPVVEVTVMWAFASVMLRTGVLRWMLLGPIREVRFVARACEPIFGLVVSTLLY
jgi:hypothetical protein